MAEPKQKSSWQKVRKFFNDLHLWMGVGSGLIIFLVCLSGTIYTFSHEIEEMAEPEKYEVEVPEGAQALSPEELIREVEHVSGGKVQSVSIPADEARTYAFQVRKEGEKGRGTSYMVNPYTGEITGSGRGATGEFFMTMFRLHRWLLLDQSIGRPIVGWATVIFFFIVLTGLVIWFPQKIKSWKQGLKIKFSGNWKRINHDLHNSLGFYSSFLLLIMALTGLCWSFGWYRDGLSVVLGTEVFGGRRGEALTSTPPTEGDAGPALTIADYIRQANEVLPYKGDYRISLPAKPEDAVSISKNKTGFFAGPSSDQVQLDQYSGAVLKVAKFEDKPLNQQIASSIKPLHTGEFFGTFSKILYFIACLVATSLPVTGVIIWINKLRKKSKKKAKGRQRSVPKAAASLA